MVTRGLQLYGQVVGGHPVHGPGRLLHRHDDGVQEVPGEQEEEQQQAEHHPHQQCADTQDAVHDKPFVHKGGDAPTRKGHLPQDEQIVAGPPVGVQGRPPVEGAVG